MKEAPQECPLCGDRTWKHRHRAGYSPDTQSDWDRFSRHVAIDHMRYCHHSSKCRDLCPCGARFSLWPEMARHLEEQDDLLVHLALALIARVGT